MTSPAFVIIFTAAILSAVIMLVCVYIAAYRLAVRAISRIRERRRRKARDAEHHALVAALQAQRMESYDHRAAEPYRVERVRQNWRGQ